MNVPFCTACIGRDDCYVWDVEVLANIVEHRGLRVQLASFNMIKVSRRTNGEQSTQEERRGSRQDKTKNLRCGWMANRQHIGSNLRIENALVHRDIEEALDLRGV